MYSWVIKFKLFKAMAKKMKNNEKTICDKRVT